MNPLRFNAVEHLGIAARDPIALAHWYQSVLGASLVFKTNTTPPAFFLRLADSLVIEIYPGAEPLPQNHINSTPGWRHVALQVDQIEPARDALLSRGVAFPDPIKPAGGGGRVLFFSDPEGNLLHLVDRPAEFNPLQR